MEPISPRVVIIGAGVAGLTAASRLFQHGFSNVVVLEAQNRIGGRIHTIPYENGFLEIGAQWIHGEKENPLHSFAMENGLVDDGEGSHGGEGLGHFYTQKGDIINEAIVQEVRQVMQEADDSCCEFVELVADGVSGSVEIPESVERHFSGRFRTYLEACNDTDGVREMKEGLYKWHLTFQCLDNACYSMNDISAITWGEFRYFEGVHWVNLCSGYGSLITTLMSFLPEKTILINSPVVTIEWSHHELLKAQTGSGPVLRLIHANKDDVTGEADSLTRFRYLYNNIEGQKYSYHTGHLAPIRLRSNNGMEFFADHVILTMSLGVLKLSHSQLFKPALPPKKQQVIANMGFGILNKIYLQFDKPFWDKQTTGFQLVWTDNGSLPIPSEDTNEDDYPWYRDITGFDIVPNHPNVLLGWVGRYGAEKMEKLSESEVGDTCVRLLRQFTRLPVTKLKKVIRSSWSSNPYFCGSYSYRTVCSDMNGDNTNDLVEPIYANADIKYPLLLFAGEATEVHHFSTVHGAYMSGKREADRIIEYYSNGESHKYEQ